MADVLSFAPGGYRYVRGVFQYSAGVAAEPGFMIDRVRFARLLPLAEGFAAIEAHLKRIGRPMTAFCACELRSPAPFDDAGFEAFNRSYVRPLEAWGIYKDGENPVARSNVCPEIDGPAEPSFYAFSYTVPADPVFRPGFVVAGSGEAMEGQKLYRDRTVRLGDQSPDAMREKAQWVLGVMEARMAALGYAWADTTATQAYTVYDLYPFLGDEIVGRGAARGGLTWQFCRPPVKDLDYEMDVRGVAREFVL